MQETFNPTTKVNEQFSMGDFFSFKSMITLRIIQVVYILVAALITLGGLMIMFKGEERGYRDVSLMPGGFMGGLLVLIFGNLIWRIWCELLVVFFTINRSLNSIEKNTRKN
ncbi:MAG: DUF4282 domain-containing protein [Chitinophagaceae bacterium]